MKILPILLSAAALCFSVAAFLRAGRPSPLPAPAPVVQSGTYLTATEREVLAHLADRVDAERAENRALDRSSRMIPPGGGLQATPVNPAPFR